MTKIKNIKSLGIQKVGTFSDPFVLNGVTMIPRMQLHDRIIASLDYSSEEYKVLAAVSRDSQMLHNFKVLHLDPHTSTAYAIWGKENYNKKFRKKAKACNFAMNYGGNEYTIANNLEIPLEEAKEVVDGYNKAFFECIAWKKNEIKKMYEKYGGTVYTIFGRPRQFITRIKKSQEFADSAYEYLEESERKERLRASKNEAGKIERRVASHQIQGACGDICRYDLLKLYKKYFKKRNPHIDFLSTVHDEINYTIDKEYLIKYVRDIEDLMTFDVIDKELPISTSTDLGYSYGNMYPFVWANDERTELKPESAE